MPQKRDKSSVSSIGSKGNGHPEDIFPIVLTSATQELFNCRADENVTGDNPYKLLKKDNIIQDIKTRAAVSDFSPVKQIVLDYPDDEILLVFDRDFTYGQSFYLVLTPEAKNRILSPPEPKTPEVLETEVNKTPQPKEWISLGSEQEIDEESVKETREKLRYKFSRVRRKFGLPVCFTDRNTADAKDGYLECASYQDSRFSIKQLQRDCGVQAVPKLQSSSAQTQWKIQKNIFTQYEAAEFKEEETENILQSESLKNFLNLVIDSVLKALQQEEIMNVFTDDWKALGTGPEVSDMSGKALSFKSLMLYQAFTDQKYTKDKNISSINWHPAIYGVIAVALTEKKEEQVNTSTMLNIRPPFIAFYSFSDPSKAQLLLECPDDIFAFEFCPSDPNIIVGGCINGQVVLWDISAHIVHLQGTQPGGKNIYKLDLNENKEKKTPVVRHYAASAIDSSHKARITDVKWLPPTFEVTRTGLPVENKNKTSVQVVTCSPDCSIMFWDIRKLQASQSASGKKQNLLTPSSVPDKFKHLDRTWKPLFRILLPKGNRSGEYGITKFNFERYTCDENTARSTEETGEIEDHEEATLDYSQLSVHLDRTPPPLEDVNTKLYIGTEDGEIIYTDWKLAKDDSGHRQTAKLLHCHNVHCWSVNTIQRSPFFKDVILVTGGWRFTIWKEGVMDGPIITSQHSEVCTAGCWSLSRPAVFFIGKEDGSIEVWNLLEKTNEPVDVHAHVTNASITCITPWIASAKQHFLAATDGSGTVRVFEIAKKLYIPSKNESLNVKKLYELEEVVLEDFLKKKPVKAQKEAGNIKKKVELNEPSDSLQASEVNMKENSDYLTVEESILQGMGLTPATGTTRDT